MNKFINHRPVAAALLFGLFGIFILRGTGWLFNSPKPPSPALAAAFLVIVPLTVGLLFVFGLGKHLKPGVESQAKVISQNLTSKGSFLLGWPLLVVSLLLLTMSVMLAGNIELSAPSASTLLFYIVFCLGTGFFEEFWFRAGVQNLFSKAFSPVKAVWVASVFFGLVHLLNLIDSPQLIIGTITQVIYTFAVGVFLGYLYLKTGSIYAAAIWHAIFDFFGLLIIVMVPPPDPSAVQPDYPLFAALLQLLIISPLLVFGWRGLNKIKAGK